MRPKKCIALLIGINDYQNTSEFPKLVNAVRDVESLAQVLRELKFEVEVCCDEDDSSTDVYLGNFLERISNANADVAVFYFAGHGASVNRYDCLIWKECPDSSFAGGVSALRHVKKVDELLTDMRDAGNQMNIVIIDACRKSCGTRGGSADTYTTSKNVPYQTLLAYSTSPGAGASDAPDKLHSPFAQSLLNHIKEENLPVEILFKTVRREMNPHGLKQLSWDYSCLVDDFSFNYGQLSTYYSKPYAEGAYKYARGFVPTFTDVVEIFNELKGTGDCRDIKGALIACATKKSMIDNDAKFVLGRTLCQKASEGNEFCRSMLNSSSFIGLYDEGEVNHLLRGIFYALYFDENDQPRKSLLGNELFWQEIESLYGLIKTKDDIKHFISMSLIDINDQFRYLIGQNKRIRVHVDVVNMDCVNSADEELLGLKIIDEEGRNILAELDMSVSFFGDEELRNALSKYYQVPIQLISLDSRLRENENRKYTKFRLDDLCYHLYQWMNRYIADEVSILSSLSYISEVSDVVIEDIQDEGMQLIVHGACDVSVHMEYDHEEIPDEYFPCKFILVCDLTDEGEYVINEENSNYLVDTESFYE